MPSKKSHRRTKHLSKFWQRGGSDDREFLVGVLLFIFIGLALAGGYATTGGNLNALNMFNNKPEGPANDYSGGSLTVTLPVAKGVNWTPWTKWQVEKGYNWEGIENDLKDMRTANISWVRLIPASEDADTARLFNLLKTYEITPIVILSGNPLKNSGNFVQRMFYKRNIKAFATKYKDQIRFYEVWNEPNNPEFWNIDADPNSNQTTYEQAVANYIERLKDTYTTIKEVNPEAFVMSGGINDDGMERWIDVFTAQKGYQYLDILSYHVYAPDPASVQQRVLSLKAAMAKVPEFGVKSIWITEFGFTTDPNDQTEKHVLDEKTKAEYLFNTTNLLRQTVFNGPTIWYKFSEQESNKPGFGLIMKDNKTLNTTYLPAYEEMKKL